MFRKKLKKFFNKRLNSIKNEFNSNRFTWIIFISLFFIGISFLLGAFINDNTDNTSSKIEATSELLGTIVAIYGLFFAISIFHKSYFVTNKLIYNHISPKNSAFIVNFVNKSRINTSVRFVGAIINDQKDIRTYSQINKMNVFNLFPSPVPLSRSKGYRKYIYGLTNIKSHNSISLRIPIRDFIKFIKHNMYSQKHVDSILKCNKAIKIKFLFVDYNKIVKYTVGKIDKNNQIYNEFKSNCMK